MTSSKSGETSSPSPIDILFPMVTFAFFGALLFGVLGASVGGALGIAIGAIVGSQETIELSESS